MIGEGIKLFAFFIEPFFLFDHYRDIITINQSSNIRRKS